MKWNSKNTTSSIQFHSFIDENLTSIEKLTKFSKSYWQFFSWTLLGKFVENLRINWCLNTPMDFCLPSTQNGLEGMGGGASRCVDPIQPFAAITPNPTTLSSTPTPLCRPRQSRAVWNAFLHLLRTFGKNARAKVCNTKPWCQFHQHFTSSFFVF